MGLAESRWPTADSPEQPNSLELKEQLRFEVNGKSYLLSFNRVDGQWYLLTAGITGGIRAFSVINDDELGFVANVVVPVGDAGAANVN